MKNHDEKKIVIVKMKMKAMKTIIVTETMTWQLS